MEAVAALPVGAPRRRLRRKTTVGSLAPTDAPALPLAAPAAPAPALALVPVTAQGQWPRRFLDEEDLCAEEASGRKATYLVTLPHPSLAAQDARGLIAPDTLTREKVAEVIFDCVAHPVYADAGAAARHMPTVRIEQMAIFREFHAPDVQGAAHAHFHVALRLSGTARFVVFKRAMQTRHRIASHWSCSHHGYWSAVRYGVMPTPKKPAASLDTEPWAWARSGTHPPLFEASQEPNTADALRRRRETKCQAASAEGNAEPRATELDLYGIIVRENFRNTADNPFAHKRLIAYLKQFASPALFQFAFRTRQKLSSLIDDVWSWETVSDDLALLGQSRWQRLLAAGQEPCVCQGSWRQCAEWCIAANGINPIEFCSYVCQTMYHGRCESLPVVVLMGRSGGEGKSFLLSPLRTIFGEEHVQASPQPGSFPLVDLESKRIVFLDEWDFSGAVVPLSTQLLWYEGKSFPITRPQNRDYVGHLHYKGTAPVYITCKEIFLGPIVKRAQDAIASGGTSQDTMLTRRLKVFSFTRKLPLASGVQIPACGSCFSNMMQHYAAQAQG